MPKSKKLQLIEKSQLKIIKNIITNIYLTKKFTPKIMMVILKKHLKQFIT